MSHFNQWTIMVLIVHFLGDFQLQSPQLAVDKQHKRQALATHLAIHGILLLYPLIRSLYYQVFWPAFYAYLMLLISHSLIDFIKIGFDKLHPSYRLYTFLIDQVLHIGLIILLGQVIFSASLVSIDPAFLNRQMLTWLLAILMVCKPANVLFKLAFSPYHHSQAIKQEGLQGAGALIGNLERILSLIFLGMGQVNAIGLIYTAKSIARFKRLEEDKGFAEYYLIGTLYSILYALCVYFLVLAR
ncbi:DUF3307 domain-containing protein [Facklamia miroungae]|uniref:DUF3307 domain-containing protein n=1 Tax=Facklamia miroungae TaxID=120956 RepID=A0A1G7PIU4_9LACT|nr:DUF3307 domain-containing protein [Facklamia miroungae]NKZ28728.1 DUF3307 domain-containing protein [Facklamia miroungae]SDF86215.1 Protein of unknown function [Facklamia miroungae]